jgi:hypothetical protein
MPQCSLHIRSVAETGLHERLTLVGFAISYFALMAVVLSSTTPLLSNNWSTGWPITLIIAGALAALLIVVGLFVGRKALRKGF